MKMEEERRASKRSMTRQKGKQHRTWRHERIIDQKDQKEQTSLREAQEAMSKVKERGVLTRKA